MRDTVVVRDTVSLPPVVVHATRIDTVSVAVVDSVLYGLDSTEVRDVLAYLLAPAATDTVFHGEGYWLDLSLGYSPLYRDFFISADLILDKETITGTRMVFKETPWWHHAALALSAGVTAYGIAKEDWWVAGIGGAGLVGVSITL